MLDKDLVRRKLAFLHEHLGELEQLAQLSLAEYTSDFVRRHAAEKVAELIVEYAIDINRIIVEAAQVSPPQTSYNTFLEMERLGILPSDLTPRLASATGLRNRLIHRYEEVDPQAVYYSLLPLLRNYREYARLIEAHVDRDENDSIKP